MTSTNDINSLLERTLSKKRKDHSTGTAEYALVLVKKYTLQFSLEDQTDIFNASLFHDIAREYSKKDLLEYAFKYHLELEKEEIEFPVLLHAPVGAHMMSQYQVLNKERMIKAVRWHSLGSIKMGLFGAILFCADYMELGRSYMNDERRNVLLTSASIEELTLNIVKQQIEHMKDCHHCISSSMNSLFKFLKNGGMFDA